MKNYISELQMFLTGTLGIILRFAYMKRKKVNISRLNIWVYFTISFGLLILLILFLRDKEELWGFALDDGTKMIIASIVSVFSEKLFTFLIDNEQLLFRKLLKKVSGIDVKKNKQKKGNHKR